MIIRKFFKASGFFVLTVACGTFACLCVWGAFQIPKTTNNDKVITSIVLFLLAFCAIFIAWARVYLRKAVETYHRADEMPWVLQQGGPIP